MIWKNPFRNRRVEWLENELAAMARRHVGDILVRQQASEIIEQGLTTRIEELRRMYEEQIQMAAALHTTLEYEALRERVETKKAHAEELSRVIEENHRLREDNKRLQILALPALRNVETEPDRSAPPSPAEDVYAGTPWQRILAREMAKQEREAREKLNAKAKPVEGESNGSSSEGRVEAPLGGAGKPA